MPIFITVGCVYDAIIRILSGTFRAWGDTRNALFKNGIVEDYWVFSG